jgi:hypothetical protein
MYSLITPQMIVYYLCELMSMSLSLELNLITWIG